MATNEKKQTKSNVQKTFLGIKTVNIDKKKVTLFTKNISETEAEALNEDEVIETTGKNGKTYFAQTFNTVRGLIQRVFKWTNEHQGSEWEMLSIEVAEVDKFLKVLTGNVDVISIPFDSGYAKDFLKRLRNIPMESVVLRPYEMENEHNGKKYKNQYLVVYKEEGEEEVKIQSFFNKENPLPQVETMKDAKGEDLIVKGNKVYDDSKLIAALVEEINHYNKKVSDFHALAKSEIGAEAVEESFEQSSGEEKPAKGKKK